MAQSFYADNRRICNARIKEELGVVLRYPVLPRGPARASSAAEAGAGQRRGAVHEPSPRASPPCSPLGALGACEPPESAAPRRRRRRPRRGDGRSATLTVGSEPQQRFEGFGFSFEQDNPYRRARAEQRKAEVDRLLYDELDTRIIRLWYAPGRPRGLRDDYPGQRHHPATRSRTA